MPTTEEMTQNDQCEAFDFVHQSLTRLARDFADKYYTDEPYKSLRTALGLVFTLTGESIVRLDGELELERNVQIIKRDKCAHLRTLVEVSEGRP